VTFGDDEVVVCLQCGWPLRRGEPITAVIAPCADGCGELEELGYVHLGICALDLITKQPRAQTQKRRAGRMSLN